MAVTWITNAGLLNTVTERIPLVIPIQVRSPDNPVTFSLIAGRLPRGLRLDQNINYDPDTGITTGYLRGSPAEVRRFTTSKFVIRAWDGFDLEDRTFSISVDGADQPEWVTREGFLNVGQGKTYFVLDNSFVNFQLEAYDPDVLAGDTLEYFLMPMGGQLPPGLSLSSDGIISGFTDPIFALEYQTSENGAYDTGGFDTSPIDFGKNNTRGYDTYIYDSVTFDLSEVPVLPRRLSRIYNFAVGVSDGTSVITRIFKIYVVTEDFLKADNSIVQVDTNLFTADNSDIRFPIWITGSDLGRFRANNYVTIFLDVYDPPALTGFLTYFLVDLNPDGSPSELPPGLELDSITGEIAGRVPYQDRVSRRYNFTVRAVDFPDPLINDSYNFLGLWDPFRTYQIDEIVRYEDLDYICLRENRNRVPSEQTLYWAVSSTSTDKTFTVEIIGELESGVRWLSAGNLGTIKPNQPSNLLVQAESQLYGGKVTFELIGGRLPPGLSLLPTGLIIGKVQQFGDSSGLGLTRFFDIVHGSIQYDTTFDGGTTSFDREFKFTIKARDSANFAENYRDFTITVISDSEKSYANLFVKSFQNRGNRLEWFDFISDISIFDPDNLYRYGDRNYGIQSEVKMLLFAGIESVEAVKYVQAMSRNHYQKRFLFGDLKTALAKDPATQQVIYEVVYVDVIDEYEKNGKSISETLELKNNINSPVLISYDAITVDSDIPFVSDRDHQRVFPNSVKNMRRRIRAVGERDREYLPLWMRSIQDDDRYELGYTKALVLCYAKPGKSREIVSRIRASGFDFKLIDFLADRYIIDMIDGEIEDKYLAFPQRGEKRP
jgi:hypothetical protein